MNSFEAWRDRPIQGDRERAVANRVAARLPVELRLADLPGPLRARSRDIGGGGICVATRSPFALSSVKGVAMHLPSGPLVLKAGGRWQREARTEDVLLSGIEIVNPQPKATQLLWECVHETALELSRFLHHRSELAGLGQADAMDLAVGMRLSQVPAGRAIYRQGTQDAGADSIFVVCEGKVVIEAGSDRAHEVSLEELGVGGIFGGLPILAGIPHVDTAVAETNLLLLAIDRYRFRSLERAKPALARRIRQLLMRKRAAQLRELARRFAPRR